MYQWLNITDNASFAPRDGAGALIFQDKMWLLGGWNPDDKVNFPRICNSEVWSSEDGRQWTLEVEQAPWEGRHCAGYVVLDDRMWIVGGDANQRHYQSDVWSSPDGKHWDLVTPSVPWGPRCLHHTVAFDGKIWILGGQSMPQYAPAAEAFYNDVWNSEDGVTWNRVSTASPWTPRGMVGGSAVFGNRMWLLGGGTYDTPERPERDFYNEVWSTADGLDWQRHADAPWAPRQYHDVAVFNDELWVMEGYNLPDGNRNDVWHSADGETWQELPETPWKPRHAASVFVDGKALWMVAGNNMESDVWRLVPADN